MDRCHRRTRPHPGSRHTLTLSPRALEVFLWLLVRAVYRFYAGSAGRSARGRIPGKSCRGRYGSRADRFVSWSDPGRSAIDTARSFQAFSNLTLTTLLYQPGNRKVKQCTLMNFHALAVFYPSSMERLACRSDGSLAAKAATASRQTVPPIIRVPGVPTA